MRLRLLLVTFALFTLIPIQAHADTTAGLQLSELLPDPVSPQTDDHDEFVEIHNAGDAIDLTGYKIKVSTHTYTFGAVTLAADGYQTVTSGGSTLSLANAGATVQLIAPGGGVIDTATYGAAKPGQSWAKFDDGSWAWSNQPTPGSANVASEPSTSPTTATPTPGTGSATATSVSPILITELLPDPASPQTDAADEFIELLNPSTDPVDISGYVIKVGKTLSSHYTLSGSIAPGSYDVLKSATTHLQLANAGSAVALFDGSNNQIDATVNYATAITGDAWARFADGWAWTTTVTPGTDNVFTAPPVKATSGTTSTKSTTTKAAKATKTTTTKAAATKKLSTKTVASKAKTATLSAAHTTAAAATSSPWLLLVLGSLTIGFIIYEFRYDVLDLYQRARRYAISRGKLSR